MPLAVLVRDRRGGLSEIRLGGGDLTQDDATRQMAARINDAAPELTHI
jgi:hypothetical protein